MEFSKEEIEAELKRRGIAIPEKKAPDKKAPETKPPKNNNHNFSKEEIEAELLRRGVAIPKKIDENSPIPGFDKEKFIEGVFTPMKMAGAALDSPFVDSYIHGTSNIPDGLLQLLTERGVFGEKAKMAHREKRAEILHNYLEAQKKAPYTAFAGNLAGDAGALLPLTPFMPGFAVKSLGRAAPPLLQTMKQGAKHGALTGAATGAAGYVNPGESRLENMISGGGGGGIVGGLLPAAFRAPGAVKDFSKWAYKYVKKMLGDKKEIAKDIFKGLLEEEIPKTAAAKQAARELGVNLTPAEASGNPIVAKKESGLGYTEQGQENIYRHKYQQKEAQKRVIDKFLSEVSPNDESVGEDIWKLSKKTIDKKKNALRDEAAPIYKEADSQALHPNTLNVLLKDSNIQDSWNQVIKKPVYGTDIEGHKLSSIKVLNLVAANLKGKYDAFIKSGQTNEARLINKSRKKLLTAMDRISPAYKKARGIYAEEMPAIEKLENGRIGKIANIKEDNVKNIPKMIFDPEETNLNNFKKIRNELQKESPGTWRGIVRNEMERRIGQSKTLYSTQNYGSNFYQSILASDKDHRRFYAALGDITGKVTPEQRKLNQMRVAFRNLINSRTAKTAAGQTETGMNQSRNAIDKLKIFYKKFIEGRYDKAAIEIITDNNWERYLTPEMRGSASKTLPKDPGKLLMLLDDVSKNLAGARVRSPSGTSEKYEDLE